MGKKKLGALLVLSAVLMIATAAYATWLLWDENGVPVCTAGDIGNHAATADGAGGVIVVWQEVPSSGWDDYDDIYAQRLNASGDVLWEIDGLDVCTADGTQYDPSIVTDGSGGAIITWLDDRDYPCEIYAQRINASGDSVWTLNGIPLTDGEVQGGQASTSDGAGGAIVVWLESYSVHAQRVDGAGNLLWGAGGVDLEVPSNGYLAITPTGSGEFMVAGQIDVGSSGSIISAQKVNLSGTPQWTQATLVTDGTSYVGSPIIVSDGSGGAIVVWNDYASEYEDIYAQRVSDTGELLWYPTGVPVCTAYGDQNYPMAVTDGVGGAIVAWIDSRTYGDYDIYAQRLNSSGSPQWTADGVNLCTSPGEQSEEYLSIVPDGAGGAMVFFESILPFTRKDIYGQRIDASGTIRLFPIGMPVLTADGQQEEPVAVSDGSSGAIVVWRDANAFGDHLYAQHVNDGVSAAAPQEIPIRGGMLAQNVPNPFSASTRISFTVASQGRANLEIFDASGRLVRVLYDGPVGSNSHTETWDGKDRNGRDLPSGMYFCRANGDGWSDVKKMTLAR